MPVSIPLVLATLFVDLPLGPPAERAARELATPWRLGEPIGEGPAVLWGIRVEARRISYEIGPAGGPAQARVVVEPSDRGGTVSVSTPGPDAAVQSAAAALVETLRDNLAARRVAFRGVPAPEAHPAGPTTGGPTARGPPDEQAARPAGQPGRFALTLLIAWLVSLLAFARPLLAAMPVATLASWASVAVVTAAVLLVAGLLPDVVSHHHGHGWDTVRAVAWPMEPGSPFRSSNPYGAFAIQWTRMLGGLAAAGDETFLASRVATGLAIVLTFCLALALTERTESALLAAGLLGVQPALLYMGRSETLTTAGLALALLCALTCLLAARSGRRRLLLPAGLSLAALASFQLLGPVCAGPVGLLLFARPTTGRHGSGYLGASVVTAAGAVLVASPHLLEMLAVIGQDAAAGSTGGLPTTLLGSSSWTGTGWRWGALLGGALLARSRPVACVALVALCLAALYGPVGAAHTWASWPRYQLWALVPIAIGVAIAVDVAGWRREPWPPRLLPWLSLPVVAAGIALSLRLPATTLAVEHPEDVQLRAWRSAAALLPEGATLVVPTTAAGQARASLPDVELLRLRPDVNLLDLDGWQQGPPHTPAYWFDPLYCYARYPDVPADPSSQCVAAQELGRHPIAVFGADTALDPRYQDDGAVADWHLIPYPERVVRTGLYSIR